MTIITQSEAQVKKSSGAFIPGWEDRSLVETKPSAQSGPPGISASAPVYVPFCNISPAGLKAKNSTFLKLLPFHAGSYPISIYTCKHLGISEIKTQNFYWSRPERDEDPDWERDKDKFAEARENLASMLDKAGRWEEASRVRNCCCEFRVYMALCCGDTLAFPYSCGHRLCPVCMRRRSAVLSERILKDILPRMVHPVHIILTVKNVEHVDKSYFSWLRSCFTKLRHRILFENVTGGGYTIETTYNSEAETWHVHLHVLADVGWIPQEELSAAWEDITGSPVVWITEVRLGGGADSETPEKAAKEIAKYIVKPGRFLNDAALVDEYLTAVKGMRLFQTFGKFLGSKVKKIFEWPFCWCGQGYWRYVGDFLLCDIFREDSKKGYYRRRRVHGLRSP